MHDDEVPADELLQAVPTEGAPAAIRQACAPLRYYLDSTR